MTPRPRLDHLDAAAAQTDFDTLVDAYLDVYADTGDEFFGKDRYRRQLTGHLAAPVWEAVTATVDDQLIGYIYGFALPADTRWWGGLLDEMPDSFIAEDSHRTVAISELLVRGPWRKKGTARALHDEFLAHRSEQRATLLVEPDNEPAYTAYTHWGWHRVAQLRPRWEGAPLYDVLILPLGT